MKAKLIRSDLDVAPKSSAYADEFVAANSVETDRKFGGVPVRRWKWGTVLDGNKVWQLVKQGVAIPADEECAECVGLNAAELADLQARYQNLVDDGSYVEELVRKANAPKIIDEGEDE